MKTILLWDIIFAAAAVIFQSISFAADNTSAPRLTVELRDGSRVVGECLVRQLKFHSEIFGDIRLDAKNVRMMEWTTTNSAQITLSNGDKLKVSFKDSALAVKTGFGKVELTAASIRKLTISSSGLTGKHSEGLVALWSGDGNVDDSAGGCSGELVNGASFTLGKIGQAFSLNEGGGTKDISPRNYIHIPAKPELNVGQGDGFTVTAWINPTSIYRQMAILEFDGSPGSSLGGVCFWISLPPANGTGSGCVYANIMESDGICHNVTSAPRLVRANVWQHIAVTYGKASGIATLYLNGDEVAKDQLGSFSARTDMDVLLGGRHFTTSASNPSDVFLGKLDEVGLYNRALSASEIREEYESGD